MTNQSARDLFVDNKLSVITFSTQDASFAIPLEQVLYIEKDVKRNIQLDELNSFNHDVITYQSSTVELYDFNKLIGSQSHRTRMMTLVGELNQFEQAHVTWLEQIENAIKNGTAIPSEPHDVTRFIKWSEQFKNGDPDLEEVIHSLAAQCKELHRDIGKVLHLAKTPDSALPKLKRIFDNSFKVFEHQLHQAAERAETSVRPIILFVEHHGGRVSALRLDNIKDIVTYDWQNFSNDDSSDGLMKKKQNDYFIEGYLRNEDRAPLMLINCKSNHRGTRASDSQASEVA